MVTNRDYRFETNLDQPVRAIMTRAIAGVRQGRRKP